jgi:hypothetical protein
MNALRFFGVVTAAALVTGCYDPDPAGPDVDVDGLSLSLSAESAPADGETIVLVLVDVPSSARGEGRKITLTTSLGTLEGATSGTLALVANAEGRATAELHAPTRTGIARIRSTVAGVIREDSVRFTAAPPTRIDVDAAKFTVAAGMRNETTVTATLRRVPGKITPGASVVFTAARGDTSEAIGFFSTAAPSDANGVVTVRFSAGDTSYRGPVIISAKHVESGLIGTTQLQIVD